MKKILGFSGIAAAGVLSLALVFAIAPAAKAQTAVNCPVGYTCTPISTNPTPVCPAGFICTPTVTAPTSTSGDCYQFSSNLSLGDTGADVVALQVYLVNNGYNIPAISSGAAPGYYGTQTETAVTSWQKANGISEKYFGEDYIGPLSRATLNTCDANVGTSTSGTGIVATLDPSSPQNSIVQISQSTQTQNVPLAVFDLKSQGESSTLQSVTMALSVTSASNMDASQVFSNVQIKTGGLTYSESSLTQAKGYGDLVMFNNMQIPLPANQYVPVTVYASVNQDTNGSINGSSVVTSLLTGDIQAIDSSYNSVPVTTGTISGNTITFMDSNGVQINNTVVSLGPVNVNQGAASTQTGTFAFSLTAGNQPIYVSKTLANYGFTSGAGVSATLVSYTDDNSVNDGSTFFYIAPGQTKTFTANFMFQAISPSGFGMFALGNIGYGTTASNPSAYSVSSQNLEALVTLTGGSTNQPTITSIYPTSGGLNTTVTINGSGFASNDTVEFDQNGQAMGGLSGPSLSSVTSNQIVFTLSNPFIANIQSGVYQVKVTPSYSVASAGSNSVNFTLAGTCTYNCGAPVTQGTLSATLMDASSNMIGTGPAFTPGNGRLTNNPYDFHWQGYLTVPQTKTVSYVQIISNDGWQGWSTSNSLNNPLNKGALYPLMVKASGGANFQTSAYNQTFSVYATTTLDMWGQPENLASWPGGKLTVVFTDGTSLTANIPASSIAPGPVTTTCPAGYICVPSGQSVQCPAGYTCTYTTVNCPSGFTCYNTTQTNQQPTISSISGTMIPGNNVTVYGQNLTNISSVYLNTTIGDKSTTYLEWANAQGSSLGIAVPNIASGQYSLIVVTTSGTSNPLTVTVSNGSAPQPLNIMSPAAGSTVYAGQNVSVAWSGNWDQGITSYAIYLIGGGLGSTGSIYLGGVYSYQTSPISVMIPSSVPSGNGYEIEFSGKGATGASSASFSIVSQNPSNQPPVISGVTAPTQLTVGQQGTWTVNASDPQNGSLSYSVDWGDSGSCPAGYTCATAAASQSFTQSATFTHSYSTAGTYNPTFTVRNSAGLTAQTSATVQVTSVPTTVACPAGYICTAPGQVTNCPAGYTCTPVTANCPSGYTCYTTAQNTTPITTVNQDSVSATLIDASSDKIGIGPAFAPGPGRVDTDPNDFHFVANLDLNQAKMVQYIQILSNDGWQGWSTSADPNNPLHKGSLYPLMTQTPTFTTTAYDQTFQVPSGQTVINMWGQPESASSWPGGNILVVFTDGTSIQADIPSSPIVPAPVVISTPPTTSTSTSSTTSQTGAAANAWNSLDLWGIIQRCYADGTYCR